MRLPILAALALLAVVAVRRFRGTVADMRLMQSDTDDVMAQPFLDSRSSATYLYNPTTGVAVSLN